MSAQSGGGLLPWGSCAFIQRGLSLQGNKQGNHLVFQLTRKLSHARLESHTYGGILAARKRHVTSQRPSSNEDTKLPEAQDHGHLCQCEASGATSMWVRRSHYLMTHIYTKRHIDLEDGLTRAPSKHVQSSISLGLMPWQGFARKSSLPSQGFQCNQNKEKQACTHLPFHYVSALSNLKTYGCAWMRKFQAIKTQHQFTNTINIKGTTQKFNLKLTHINHS